MVILGEECKCLRKAPKQAIQWALEYHISNLVREVDQKTDLVRLAKAEFREITGFDPKAYVMEHAIERLKKELDFYKELREEIIKLPNCIESAFEVR